MSRRILRACPPDTLCMESMHRCPHQPYLPSRTRKRWMPAQSTALSHTSRKCFHLMGCTDQLDTADSELLHGG